MSEAQIQLTAKTLQTTLKRSKKLSRHSMLLVSQISKMNACRLNLWMLPRLKAWKISLLLLFSHLVDLETTHTWSIPIHLSVVPACQKRQAEEASLAQLNLKVLSLVLSLEHPEHLAHLVLLEVLDDSEKVMVDKQVCKFFLLRGYLCVVLTILEQGYNYDKSFY